MANWYGTARTNYFAVKDREAFNAWVDGFNGGVGIFTEKRGEEILVGLYSDNDGYWPSMRDTEEGLVDVDFEAELAAHLADGEVAIQMSAGAEKLAYISGQAVAFNNKGERREVWLNEIDALARELTDRPEDITDCAY
jgi:hypothetical protein